MSQLVEDAARFAIAAHSPQIRKYSGLPYWTHLRDVALILQETECKETLVAAGWLHDVLEDCPHIRERELRANFPHGVVDLVIELTEVITEGNRATRKKREAERLAGISTAGQTIKCADLIANTRDIVFSEHKDAVSFAPVYIAEKHNIMMGFRSNPLRARAMVMLDIGQMNVARRIARSGR